MDTGYVITAFITIAILAVCGGLFSSSKKSMTDEEYKKHLEDADKAYRDEVTKSKLPPKEYDFFEDEEDWSNIHI